MAGCVGPVWSIPFVGGRVEIPSSVGGVRATLDGEALAEFEAELARTPAKVLVYVILDRALPPGTEGEDAVTVARLRGGDFTGVLDEDGKPVAPTHPPLAPGEVASPVWYMGFSVGAKTFPATLDGVRAVLETGKLAEFEADIAATPGHELIYAALRWGYPPEDLAEEDALIEELKAAERRAIEQGVEGL